MAFPTTPRDVVAELFVTGAWTDITTDVFARDSIGISRARRNQGSRPEPSALSAQLNNALGKYSPRNPIGLYYGSLTRNTPLRVGVRTARDTFARTVSGGWASAETGQAWSVVGAGGSILASDWNVGSSVGTQSVPVANAYRVSYLATELHRDVDVAVTVTLPFTDVTGASIEPANILLRGQSVTDYYRVVVAVTTAEAVTVGLQHYDGTVIAAAVTVAGLTHSSSQALRVRAQAEGHTLRAKVWAAAGAEPYGWHVTAHSELISAAGWVAVRTGVASGNTNTKPIVASYDSFEIKLPRFAGEVSSWPQRWDVSGNDRWVPIEGAGIGRRLGQGTAALVSPLRRGLLSDAIATPVAYWPCEEAARANLIASALPNAKPMFVAFGTPSFAGSNEFDCSDPIPQPKDSVWTGGVPAHTVSGRAQVRCLLAVPDAGIAEQGLIMIGTSGSIAQWFVVVDAAGDLKLQAYNRAGALVYDSGYFAYAVNGSPLWLSVEFEQVGSAVEANLVTLRPGAASGSQLPFTSISSQTVGTTQSLLVGSIGDVGIGHISVHNVWSSLFDLGSQLAAWAGETAGARAQRLCAEEGIPFSYIGDLAETAAMGPQKSRTFIDLLNECADADLGTLYESRGDLGLVYRTRASAYRQSATLALDYSARQVSAPFEPVDDDQLVRNDITAKRVDGSSARAVLETGPMSVLPPPDGIGRYDDQAEVAVAGDDQLGDVAGWLLALGTVDEARYPAVTVDLTTPGVVTAGLEPQVLDVDVDDRLTIDNLPAGQPPGQVSQLVRGYTETINLFEHTLTYNCSPESPYQVAVLDDVDKRVDSGSSTLVGGINSTVNSFGVATADPTDLWITTTSRPGDFPVLVTIGGEDMSVGAISGASSPQTFSSVTRSVNGVEKSHSTGDQVRVTHPLPLAL